MSIIYTVANQGHKIKLIQPMYKYTWNETSSLEPLPAELDAFNTEDSISKKRKWNDCPWILKLYASA